MQGGQGDSTMAFKFQGFDFLHLDASLSEEELLVRAPRANLSKTM